MVFALDSNRFQRRHWYGEMRILDTKPQTQRKKTWATASKSLLCSQQLEKKRDYFPNIWIQGTSKADRACMNLLITKN